MSSIYVDHPCEPVVDHPCEPVGLVKWEFSEAEESPNTYGRVPLTVLSDHRLKDRDIRIFAVLSTVVWQGRVAQIGTRRVSEMAGVSRRLVIESLKRLARCGHLKPESIKAGARARYELTSPVFGKKQRDGVREVATGPSGGKRLVSAPRRKSA